jgi:hypothetical protein
MIIVRTPSTVEKGTETQSTIGGQQHAAEMRDTRGR